VRKKRIKNENGGRERQDNVSYKRVAHISEWRTLHHDASYLHITSNFSTSYHISYFKGSEGDLGP